MRFVAFVDPRRRRYECCLDGDGPSAADEVPQASLEDLHGWTSTLFFFRDSDSKENNDVSGKA